MRCMKRIIFFASASVRNTRPDLARAVRKPSNEEGKLTSSP